MIERCYRTFIDLEFRVLSVLSTNILISKLFLLCIVSDIVHVCHCSIVVSQCFWRENSFVAGFFFLATSNICHVSFFFRFVKGMRFLSSRV